MSRFEATRELFWDGHYYFKPWSDDEDYAPLSKLLHHTNGDYVCPATDLTSTRPVYTVDPSWNRVSKLRFSGPEAAILWSRSRDCATRPLRPLLRVKFKHHFY
ncbi:hypothetical protein AVEN_28907-1 [Araneus ventricosus]|uniref:Uncharacterized protein n=1 Tax=Araneus ventricosus TaxID=182803 RepID=A0A4Y2AKS0_ARAVE|nr:hypothetical protein AVEN_28907-1 [Araneus ventricosus]